MDEVYPRVGGGNASREITLRQQQGLSPRGRGKPADTPITADTPRSIPAWAGETLRTLRLTLPVRVYPRVGGGNLGRPDEP